MDRRFPASFLMYAIAFAAAGLAPFVLLPFLTRQLTSAEFGIATLFVTLCQLLANFSSLGTHGYVSVRFFKGETRGWGSAVSAALSVILAVHAALLAVFLVAGWWFSDLLALPHGALLMVIVTSLLMCMNFVFLAVYQSSNRPQYYLLARCVQSALEIGLCLFVLFYLASTADARIYTLPVAVAAAGLLGTFYCLRTGAFSITGFKDSLRGALRFGLPMLPHVAAGTLVSFLDRLIIASVMGPDDLGIYMAASQLGLVMLLVIEPFNKAFAPWLFARLSENTEATRVTIVRFTYLFFAVLLTVGIATAIAALAFYDLVVGAEFASGRVLVPLIIAGYALQGMYYTVVNYLFFVEKTHILSAISLTTVLIGSAVTYSMVSTFGLVGAAASLAINNGLMFGLVWFFAAREVKLPWLAAVSVRARLRGAGR